MFAQVIQGRTSDAAALRAALEQWTTDLAPGAAGWLGSTAGVTDDGRVVAVARFESAEAARRNSERPEQTQWWEETRRIFDGEPTFLDSEDVTDEVAGDPDRAGFVQVIQGRVTDADRARELMQGMPGERMAEYRPDVLGMLMIGHDSGRWTQVVYFTSEAEAREGERKETPLEMQHVMDEMAKLNVGQPEFFDLRQPVLQSPR